MSVIIFEGDPASRKVTRGFLVLQVTAMLIVIGMVLLKLYALALILSLLTFIIFIAILFWIYLRYQKIPMVREKHNLRQRALSTQSKLRAEEIKIQAARKKRQELLQAEKAEATMALKGLQEAYIQHGLANTPIKDALIPGIGPKLRERLADSDILNAAQITDKISELPGFGESKYQALVDWQRRIIARLDSTKPISLPTEQFQSITQKYQALRQKNGAAEKDAQENKRALEYDLISFALRLKQLAPITFTAYLSKSLASRGFGAAFVAFLLIISQVISSVSATTSSLIASIPTATRTPTVALTSTATAVPSPTATMSQTITPTITLTSSITSTLTTTSTSPATVTSLPTFTPLVISQPSNTPNIPVSGGCGTDNCHPSYPGVCIPPPPPDLDCPEVPYENFQVLPPDPHNFDREGDGVGCEG